MKNEIAAPDHLLIFASPPRLCQTLCLSILTSQTFSLLTSRQLTFSIEPPPTKTQAYLLIWAAPHHASLMPFSPSPSIADPLMPISPSPSMAAHHASLMPISYSSSITSPSSAHASLMAIYHSPSLTAPLTPQTWRSPLSSLYSFPPLPLTLLPPLCQDSSIRVLFFLINKRNCTDKKYIKFKKTNRRFWGRRFDRNRSLDFELWWRYFLANFSSSDWMQNQMFFQIFKSVGCCVDGCSIVEFVCCSVDGYCFVLAWFCFVESVVCCVFKFLLLGFYFGMANGSISTVTFLFASADTICGNGSRITLENKEVILTLHFAPPARDKINKKNQIFEFLTLTWCLCRCRTFLTWGMHIISTSATESRPRK